MAKRAVILVTLLVVAGCASKDPVRVEVPVPQRVKPPSELMEPIKTPGPIFTPPGPKALACVSPSGKDALMVYVDALRVRITAWEAWAE